MSDSLLDDVKELLNKNEGDEHILKQILRACENNEIISNYERNYVRKLAEKHLNRKPLAEQTKILEEKPVIPDIIIPKIPSPSQMFQPIPSQISSSNSKNSKIILGVIGIVLVIIIAASVSFSGISDVSPKTEIPNDLISLSVNTDLTSYDKKDIIAISGTSKTFGTVNISILNQNSKLVWAEQISVKNNGEYSTLSIAGGEGWENSGTYTIKSNDGITTKSNTFSFNANSIQPSNQITPTEKFNQDNVSTSSLTKSQ